VKTQQDVAQLSTCHVKKFGYSSKAGCCVSHFDGGLQDFVGIRSADG
jgi:hypothetical protein